MLFENQVCSCFFACIYYGVIKYIYLCRHAVKPSASDDSLLCRTLGAKHFAKHIDQAAMHLGKEKTVYQIEFFFLPNRDGKSSLYWDDLWNGSVRALQFTRACSYATNKDRFNL